jgi:ubiquinone/menaquinone biosynthesis C-methylase UbiE
MQLQEYFDQLAPIWDEKLSPEKITRLSDTIKELGVKPGYGVLDVGSGTGVLLPFLAAGVGNEGRIIALDFSEEMLVQARVRNSSSIVDFVQADGMAVPLADGSVDLALCNGVFPHFSDQGRALKEMARVLRNNGRLVISHTMGREMINQLHQSIRGAVANDLLPDEVRLRELLNQAGLYITYFEDRPERYLVIAEKAVR